MLGKEDKPPSDLTTLRLSPPPGGERANLSYALRSWGQLSFFLGSLSHTRTDVSDRPVLSSGTVAVAMSGFPRHQGWGGGGGGGGGGGRQLRQICLSPRVGKGLPLMPYRLVV